MSSVVVQKQVGQTIVQLPQVRQRSATSSQRSDSRLSRSSAARSGSGICRPIRPAAARTASAGLGALRRRPAGGRSRPSTRAAFLGADVGDETVPGVVDPLGQRQVVAGPGLGPVPIEAQKQTPPGSVQPAATTNRPAPAPSEPGVGVRAAAQDPAQDGDRGQVTARARRGRRSRTALFRGGEPAAVRRPQPLPRRVQELLPGLRAGRVAEHGLVAAAAQPVPARRRCPRPSRTAGRRRS